MEDYMSFFKSVEPGISLSLSLSRSRLKQCEDKGHFCLN